MIEFTVMGVPTAKGRPRVTRRGVTFTPAKTRAAEDSFIAQCISRRPEKPIGVAIRLSVTFIMPIPKSSTKVFRQICASGEEPHIKKPDLDNLVKLVKDALNGIFWRDDSLVSDLIAKKRYGEIARTIVKIEEL